MPVANTSSKPHTKADAQPQTDANGDPNAIYFLDAERRVVTISDVHPTETTSVGDPEPYPGAHIVRDGYANAIRDGYTGEDIVTYARGYVAAHRID